MMRVVLRRYLEPRPKLYAVHVSWAGASFIKHYDYFYAQGGTTQEWGKHWRIVLAFNDEAVRLFAINVMSARRDALFCPTCGAEYHGACTKLPPVEAVEVNKSVALEEWERAHKRS
jgi:hypothetical protein